MNQDQQVRLEVAVKAYVAFLKIFQREECFKRGVVGGKFSLEAFLASRVFDEKRDIIRDAISDALVSDVQLGAAIADVFELSSWYGDLLNRTQLERGLFLLALLNAGVDLCEGDVHPSFYIGRLDAAMCDYLNSQFGLTRKGAIMALDLIQAEVNEKVKQLA